MASEERTYMVMAIDENGDNHLFASDNEQRALAALTDMKTKYPEAVANWIEREEQ